MRSHLVCGRKALKRGDDVFDIHDVAVFRIHIEQVHQMSQRYAVGDALPRDNDAKPGRDGIDHRARTQPLVELPVTTTVSIPQRVR